MRIWGAIAANSGTKPSVKMFALLNPKRLHPAGGEGTMEPSTAVFGEKFTMSENGFTREGYTFAGWNSRADGTGVSYTAGKSYTKTSAKNLTVYAQWKVNQYTLTVKPENGEEDIVLTQDYGTAITVETPVWEGHTFSCWIDEDGEVVNVPATMPAKNLTFTAQWQRTMATVTVNKTGDGLVSSNVDLNAVPIGTYVTLTFTPTNYSEYVIVNGERFTGGTSYTVLVTEDMTINVTFVKESFINGGYDTSSAKQSWYERALEIYADMIK